MANSTRVDYYCTRESGEEWGWLETGVYNSSKGRRKRDMGRSDSSGQASLSRAIGHMQCHGHDGSAKYVRVQMSRGHVTDGPGTERPTSGRGWAIRHGASVEPEPATLAIIDKVLPSQAVFPLHNRQPARCAVSWSTNKICCYLSF